MKTFMAIGNKVMVRKEEAHIHSPGVTVMKLGTYEPYEQCSSAQEAKDLADSLNHQTLRIKE